MAVDTPAKIAVIGAGPIGLEAGLYARFLGYDVELYDRGEVAANVRQWGHVRMFSPFHMNRSTLGIAAIAAQNPGYRPPPDEAVLTGDEWYTNYLQPLSQTDLLADHLNLRTAVKSVARIGCLKAELPGDEQRRETDFRLVLEHQDGSESEATAEVVIDAGGVYHHPNYMGQGGAAALGELALRNAIEYGVPDILGRDRAHYAGLHTLVVGGGHSAATTIVQLEELQRQEPSTRFTWIIRRAATAPQTIGPLVEIPDDRLAGRAELVRRANALAANPAAGSVCWTNTEVAALARQEDQFNVMLAGDQAGTVVVDRIVANVGGRPDLSVFEELQVQTCYATEGPIKLAASLLQNASVDCLVQTTPGPQALLNPEPDYYVIGAKSYGRMSNFLTSIGIQQIRQLFTIIGDREDLDLYATAINLMPTQP